MLPSDYRQILTNGIKALHETEARLRARADSTPESPELWMRVRDVQALSFRLRLEEDWSWQTGGGTDLVTSRDFGVLEEALVDANASPYNDAHAIAELITFLHRYDRGDFALEDLDALPAPTESREK